MDIVPILEAFDFHIQEEDVDIAFFELPKWEDSLLHINLKVHFTYYFKKIWILKTNIIK